MRILLLADIHSNWAALRAVHEDVGEFDVCCVLGDLVDYGSDPIPCIDWVRRWGNHVVRGNHDHAVAQRVPARSDRGLRRLAGASRAWHWQILDPSRQKFLARLPITRTIEIGDSTYHLVHATPRDPMDEYLLADSSAWQARLSDVDADFICVGHTHIPFQISFAGTQVINPGSVGQPRDGDSRAAYAIIDDGVVQLRRVDYDIEEALQQMRSTELDPWVWRLTEAFLCSGGQMTPDEMDQIV